MKRMILLSTVTALLLTSCKTPDANAAVNAKGASEEAPIIAQKEPLPVEAVIANTQEVAQQISGAVTTAGIREVFLSAKAGGAITSVPGKLGQRIRRGKAIISVESQVQKAALEQAKVSVQEAELNFTAVKRLYQKGSVSEAEYIRTEGMLSAAKAGFEMSKYNYNNCWLRAPFTGALTYLDPIAEKGNMIAAGTPVARMVDISQLKLNLYVGESEIIRINKGNRAALTVSALNMTLEGEVTAVAEGSDPATGSFLVEVTTDNPDEIVKSGMTGRVTIDTDEKNFGVVVPSSAIIHRGERSYVMTAQNGITNTVQVETTPIRNNRVVVEGAVGYGDTLVITGLTKLVSGDPVLTTIVEK